MSTQTSNNSPALSEEGAFTRFLRATEIDTRMLGMIAALILIWVGFDVYSGTLRQGDGLFGGSFLTPRNLWILMVQTSTIAVMTTGMVLVIVLRQIDLSVGSMLSIVAVATGVLQVYELGPMLGLGHPVHLDHCRCLRHSAGCCDWLLKRRPRRLRPDSILHCHARRPHRL